MFRAPIRGVDRGVEQEGPDGRKFAREVPGEALHLGHAARPVEPLGQSRDELPAGHGESVCRQGARVMRIAHRQRALQNRLHVGGEGRARVIGGHEPTAAQQVGQTRLVRRGGELPIRGPAIADQDAPEVGTQHGGRLVEAAPGLNAIDGGVGRREGPQPLQLAADFPARFIGADHRAAAHARTQGRVGGTGPPRRAMHRVYQPAARDREAIELLHERHDLAEREPELFIEHDDQRDHLRAELRRGRANRIGRLQRMPALDAPAAARTATDVHVKLADHDTRHGELFLILVDDASRHHRTGAVRTVRGQRRRVAFIDVSGTSPPCLRPIPTAGFPAWSLRMRLHRLRKRRRLPASGPPCVIELSFELVDLLTKPFSVALPVLLLTSQRIALALGLLGALTPIDVAAIRLAWLRRFWHAAVMPEISVEYKPR